MIQGSRYRTAEAPTKKIQLIDGSGVFNVAGLDEFVNHSRLTERGLSYAVVSILGPQSSGKSTLLNLLFGTTFPEMDANKGRMQTTQGVWLAQAAGIQPCTLVLDLEGTDGGKRGEDDTAFEKQSSLFALAVSDVVIINMWCHDIGRHHASNKSLLKNVFQVMMRVFSPRKTTLLFVIRDKLQSPEGVLADMLKKDIEAIWSSISKPEKYRNSNISDFFLVKYICFANYEHEQPVFRQQVEELRRRFMNSTAPGGLLSNRRTVVPGAGFSWHTKKIWKDIKENKDLDLPALKIMVATVRCEEIAKKVFMVFEKDEEWKNISEEAQCGPVPGFGKRLGMLLDKHIISYDTEAMHFEAGVPDEKKQFLIERLLELVQPAYHAVLAHHQKKALTSFKRSLNSNKESFFPRCVAESLLEFDQGCADSTLNMKEISSKLKHNVASKLRETLLCDMDAFEQTVKAQRLADRNARISTTAQVACVVLGSIVGVSIPLLTE